jgi:3-oxoacid CoA-transferase subunit A
VAEGKPTEEFDGKSYIRERWLRADLSIVRAWKGDTHGNLVFRKTARNFNPPMATAGAITVAEVEEVVEPGALNPDMVHTPGIYVNRVVRGAHYDRRIEKLTVREPVR